jgi:hypothetical protein
MLRLPHVEDDRSPARGEGKCCTISSKSNRNESLVSVEPGLALWGGIKFMSFERVGVSAVMLKFPSKLTCLSSDRGDSKGPFRLCSPFPPLLNTNPLREGVSPGGPMSLNWRECRGGTGLAVPVDSTCSDRQTAQALNRVYERVYERKR